MKSFKEYCAEQDLNKSFDLDDYSLDEIHSFIESDEFESLDELSKDTLKDYIRKSWSENGVKNGKLGVDIGASIQKGDYSKVGQRREKQDKRLHGLWTATRKLANESEEFNLDDYSLDEIQDFIGSSDFEALDELSKKTLGSYIRRASDDKADRQAHAEFTAGIEADENEPKHIRKRAGEISDRQNSISNKRTVGIGKAVSRLTKESEDFDLDDYSLDELTSFIESNEFESLDELSKHTLSRYINKAYKDYNMVADAPGYSKEKIKQKLMKRRMSGIKSAEGKLAKESVETNEDFGSMASTLGKYGKGTPADVRRPTKSKFNDQTLTGHDVKRTSTGTVYTRDLDKEVDNEPAEKRGRGRPVGSFVDKGYKARSPETAAAARAKAAATKAANKAAKAALTKEDCFEIFDGKFSIDEEIQFFMSAEFRGLDEQNQTTLKDFLKEGKFEEVTRKEGLGEPNGTSEQNAKFKQLQKLTSGEGNSPNNLQMTKESVMDYYVKNINSKYIAAH